jgi:predicted PurR-regulated permease PerM
MMQLKLVAPGEVARIMLLVISIGLLLTGSLWILLPFLVAVAWATMIVIATWPILLKVQQSAGGRRWVAVIHSPAAPARC